MLISCRNCNKEIEVLEKEINRGNGKFCSLNCFHVNRRNQPKIAKPPNCKCSFCHTEFYRNNSKQKSSKSGHYFCNRKCKEAAQKLGGIKEIMPPHYGVGNGKYRYLFSDEELVCSRCGYKEFQCAVEIHHIDHNRKNNNKKNLIPLCACCHVGLHMKLWTLGL